MFEPFAGIDKRTSPFFVDGTLNATFGAEEIHELLNRLDPQAKLYMLEILPQHEWFELEPILLYLNEVCPVLYKTLEKILITYQQAQCLAAAQTDNLVESYVLFNTANTCLESINLELLQKDLEKQKTQGNARKLPAKKRRDPPTDVDDAERTKLQKSLLRNIESSLTQLAPKKIKQLKDYKQTPFAIFTDMHAFRGASLKKGVKHDPIEVIEQAAEWETVFHPNGAWEAQEIVDFLERDKIFCRVIRRNKANSDRDFDAYKVLVGKEKINNL